MLGAIAAKEEKGCQHQKGGNGGVKGTNNGLVDSAIDHMFIVIIIRAAQQLSRAVKSDDGIVHREAQNSQQRGDEQAVNLPAHKMSHKGINSYGGYEIMYQS